MSKMKKTLLSMAKALFGGVVTLGLQTMLARGADVTTVSVVAAAALGVAILLYVSFKLK